MDTPPDDGGERGSRGGDLTRRKVLQGGALSALGLAGSGLLAACGSSSGVSGGGTGGEAPVGSLKGDSAGGGMPVRGGTMRLGVITGGTAETLNPAKATVNPDLARLPNLFNTLFRVGPDIKTLIPMLAEGAEPNKTATVWTLKVRGGVSWHDGKPLTADDVVATMRGWKDPTNLANGNLQGIVDWDRIRKRGPLDVEIPLLAPVAQFPTLLTFFNQMIVQEGATPESLATNPIGTGPFKFSSFTPGRESVFDRFEDYWEDGNLPYVDQLVVNSSFSDDISLVNALQGGQLDAVGLIPGILARQNESNPSVKILSSPGNNAYQFAMRVDRPPFNDNRVRQAIRLLADRQAIIDGAFSGFGTVQHDLQGDYTDYFAADLKREQDVEKAKSLLKAAGQENLSLTLPAANAAPGQLEAATIFASQAKAGGVDISVKQTPAATYFSPAAGYLSAPFYMDSQSASFPSLSMTYRLQYTKTAPYNGTHWGSQPNSGPAEKLLASAIAELDEAKAEERWREVQMIQFNEGGAVVFGCYDFIDAVSPDVRGLKTTGAGPFNNWRMLEGWLAS